MGLGTTVAFAGNLTSGVETVMAVNDFTPIEVKDLAQRKLLVGKF